MTEGGSDEIGPLMRRFRVVSMRLIGWPRAGCEHVAPDSEVYACLCCDPTTPRCRSCHAAHLTDICPICDGTIEPVAGISELRHVIEYRYEGGAMSGVGDITAKILHAYVCATCAIDNDVTSL